MSQPKVVPAAEVAPGAVGSHDHREDQGGRLEVEALWATGALRKSVLGSTATAPWGEEAIVRAGSVTGPLLCASGFGRLV